MPQVAFNRLRARRNWRSAKFERLLNSFYLSFSPPLSPGAPVPDDPMNNLRPSG